MKFNWKYIDCSDLISLHIEVTKLSYNTHSREYAKAWEWNKEIMAKTKKDYLSAFMKKIVKDGTVLVVGCGTGRDLETLGKNGFKCIGVDSSVGMLEEYLSKEKGSFPVINISLEEVPLVKESMDGVLIDSALEHIKKSDIPNILQKIYSSLKVNGIALVRFRRGKGNVFWVNDIVGERYFTSYTIKEMENIIKNTKFKVIEKYERDHLESTRPGFFTYILRK